MKPWLLLSGDDDGKHYIMTPQSEDRDDWNYDLELLVETGNFKLGGYMDTAYVSKLLKN